MLKDLLKGFKWNDQNFEAFDCEVGRIRPCVVKKALPGVAKGCFFGGF